MDALLINQLREQLDIKTKECIRLEQMLREVQDRNKTLEEELDNKKEVLDWYIDSEPNIDPNWEEELLEEFSSLEDILFKAIDSMCELRSRTTSL